MTTPAAVLLGGNPLNVGVFDNFKRRGWHVIVVDWNEVPGLRGDHHLRMDVKAAPAVVAALKQLSEYDIQVAYTSIDVAVPTVVAIHRHYGLQTPQGDSYTTPVTKARMTEVWQEAGLLNRFSKLLPVGDETALERIAGEREVIVKPNLSSSSRGITILAAGASRQARVAALNRAEQTSFDGQAIVEEFFPGREFTVEMLGDSHGNVAVYGISVKYHTQNAGPNRVANKLHYNSLAYPEATYQRIADYARRCYASLGLNCSLGHLEILMREDGLLSPVEIGARSSGLILTPLAEIASGRDFLGDYLAVLRGARVESAFYQGPDAAMYFFYDFPPDRPCRHKAHLLEYLPLGIESLYADREAIAADKVYGRIDNDAERPGYEILRGRRDTLTIETVAAAEQRMLAFMFNGTK